MNRKTKILSIRVEEAEAEIFARLYPNCLPRFIKNCIKKASLDKAFFYTLFFNDSETFDVSDISNIKGD